MQLEAESPAALFKRAARDPDSLQADDWARLSADDRGLLCALLEQQLHAVDSLARLRAGARLRPNPHRLTDDRLRELVRLAGRPGFRVTSIPLDEYTALALNPDQWALLEQALARRSEAS